MQIEEIVKIEPLEIEAPADSLPADALSLDAATLRSLEAKGLLRPPPGQAVQDHRRRRARPRRALGVRPVYKRVDTCAAEFGTNTAYMYLHLDLRPGGCEARPPTDNAKKIMVLGGGPNRIGQGIEFDYCCVHAALAMREDGYETIMVNCNPKPCPPTTTRRTACISSRSRWKTCWKSWTRKSRWA